VEHLRSMVGSRASALKLCVNIAIALVVIPSILMGWWLVLGWLWPSSN